jgi:hypothetical protein
MTYTISQLPEVEHEIIEAALWYEMQKDGLGDELFHFIDEKISEVKNNPLQFEVAFKNCRRAIIKKFPYSIFYIPDERKIIIVAIIHQSRNPDILKKRIKNIYKK